MPIKFLKKGIKYNGKYIPVRYSKGDYTKESKIPQNSITIYAKGYEELPSVLAPTNATDSQTDYFEKDRAVITPSNKFYGQVRRVA